METHIYLIRHGETAWNKEKRVQGHKDMPLSSAGEEQARRLGQRFSKQEISAVYSSDLTRAVQTAEYVAGDRTLIVGRMVEFRERYMGDWEGLLIAEVKKRHPGEWEEVWHRGGKYGVESTEEVKDRMIAKLQRLIVRHPGERIVVVSHGGAINGVLEEVSEGVHGPGRTRIRNTAVSHLVFQPKHGWHVKQVNCAAHLEAPPAEPHPSEPL
ncbi:histidine phosphatase family protein [Salinithrix halophila]|uniref:Histidine phosphatase family protein n=1 Tax=Salinithrix halophila TaxID=1485204 RepID=A0ABV8JGH9_9BACL